MSQPKRRKRHLPYDAETRNKHYGIRRGIPVKRGRPTGEHPSEVHASKGAKA